MTVPFFVAAECAVTVFRGIFRMSAHFAVYDRNARFVSCFFLPNGCTINLRKIYKPFKFSPQYNKEEL